MGLSCNVSSPTTSSSKPTWTKEGPPSSLSGGVRGPILLYSASRRLGDPNRRTRRIPHRRRGTVPRDRCPLPLGLGNPSVEVEAARVMSHEKRIGSEYTHSGISTRLFAHQSSVGEMTPATLYPGSGGGKPRGRAPMLLQSEGRLVRRNGGRGMVPRLANRPQLEAGAGRLASYPVSTRKETRMPEVSYA